MMSYANLMHHNLLTSHMPLPMVFVYKEALHSSKIIFKLTETVYQQFILYISVVYSINKVRTRPYEIKMAHSQWKNTCCNPFQKANHSSVRKNLRPVTKWMCEKVPSIIEGSKICDDCRKKLSKFNPEVVDSTSDAELPPISATCSDKVPCSDTTTSAAKSVFA